MESDKVSIIVPIYNVDNYLKKCIDSLIKQTYKNLEIILVDDGSPDTSGKICDDYALIDSRVKVIHKNNGGVSQTRNTGIEHATGDYICFVDGDDFVMDDYVSYMYNLIKKGDYEISITTDMFGNFNENQNNNIKDYEATGVESTNLILSYRIPIGCYCKLFKKDFLVKNNIRFFEDIFIGEGFNFNVLAFQYAKKVRIGNKKTYYYRRDNPTSAMTKFNIKKCECELYALDRIKNSFIIDFKFVENSWKYAVWRTKSDVYDLIKIANKSLEYPDIYKKVKKDLRKGFFLSLRCSVSNKDRLRAFVFMIFPPLIPFAMNIRKKIYKI